MPHMAGMASTFDLGAGPEQRAEGNIGHRLLVHWSRGSLRPRRSAPASRPSASPAGAANGAGLASSGLQRTTPTEEMSSSGIASVPNASGQSRWPRLKAFIGAVWERTVVAFEVLGRVLLLLLPGFSTRGLRRILRAVRLAVRAAAADLGFDVARGRRSHARRRRLDPRIGSTEIRLLSRDLVSGNLLRAISQADVVSGPQVIGLQGRTAQEAPRSALGGLANLAALANLSLDSNGFNRTMVVSIDFSIDEREEEQISGLGTEQVAWWLAQDQRLADYDHVAAMDPPWCCPICTEGLEGEQAHGWLVTICGEGCDDGHLYHEACLREWLLKSNTCPVCRRNPVVCPDAEPVPSPAC